VGDAGRRENNCFALAEHGTAETPAVLQQKPRENPNELDWESDHEPSDEQVAWMERG
jgi:hypothetical protein